MGFGIALGYMQVGLDTQDQLCIQALVLKKDYEKMSNFLAQFSQIVENL